MAAEVSADANDHGKLNAMVDEIVVVADAGYASEKDLAQLEERKVEGYVALGREGRAIYAQRKWMAEAPIGWIKHVMGFRRFSVRGLGQVQGEWTLVCLALNLQRLNGNLRPVDDNGTENGAKQPAIRSKKTTPMRRFGPLLDVAYVSSQQGLLHFFV